MMKDLGIAKSILSMSSPGTHLFPGDDQQARTLTREVNEYMSEVCSQYKPYFQFFASLPLPDVEGSLVEIDYAVDHLGAVGFQILTNAHGIYPGDPRFRPVYDKLSERKTIVFVHPTSCNLQRETGSVEHVNPLAGVPSPLMEFMFDTTRALTSLLVSGTVTRCPGIKFLICHCGATLPPIAARIAEFSQFLLEDGEPISLETIKNLLQFRFYIDLAGVPFPDQIHGLLRHVDATRLLYGSDYPFTPAPLAKSLARRLDDGLMTDFGAEIKERILLTNAQSLFDGR
ncbi:Decarboxylase yanB [Penicillium rolfsii]|nr:Decarboxylase yanB [Penicillium rolfsii]